MGNQLVGIAPSQIFPVEHYLSEHQDLQFDINLGSTRFFKVARAKSQEGLIVVKVFAIHDPTLPLASYKDKLEEIRNDLSSSVNCLPFQRTIMTDKAGFIMREYVKYSLYDRISTRPFLTSVEKRWIAFQILYALHQCHKVGVCHGDIKLENIMVTSWNWVLLTDFASYKPTYLPEDNPADYSYFFDTSRRRTCYIAPERFIKTLTSELSSQLMLPEDNLKKGDLTPAMDIFSAGCSLTELFNEGHPPFDFSQLLAYRSGEFNVAQQLDKLEDKNIRDLLSHMLQKDPTQRLSAELYLDQQRGVMFPEYFYSFLQSYMLIFSSGNPIMSPDDKVARLKKDIKNIINIFLPDKEEKGDSGKDSGAGSTADGLIIITSLVTSCIRGLHHCTSKLSCLDVLLELAQHVSGETILDRILPFVFHLARDAFPRVRVRAIHVLTECLAVVETVPPSDSNIFPEYVFPGLAHVVNDDAVMVRCAYAENVAALADTALRYLEQSQAAQLDATATARPVYEHEVATLHNMVQSTAAAMLSDTHSLVKQTLMEAGITKLCIFFGKQKANDILLSHIITFLNDKEDKELRASFFDCIIGIAAYVGCYSSSILLPLLQQGLTDPEEFVVTKAINAMTALTELGLLNKASLYELLAETASFLVHPNLWIRQATVGFLSAMSRTLNIVDVQCKVLAVMRPYLTHPVIQADKEVILLNALATPIPRVVYDSVVKCPDIADLLETLEGRRKARSLVKEGHLAQHIEPPAVLKNLFRRLVSEGMTDEVEDQLLSMHWHLHKTHKYRETKQRPPTGKIDLGSLKNPTKCHALPLNPIEPNKVDPGTAVSYSRRLRPRRPPLLESHITTMNEEWHHMFGGSELPSPAQRLSEGGTSPPGGSLSSDPHLSPQRSLETDHSLHERSYIQYRCAPCCLELRQLAYRKQELHSIAMQGREWAEQAAWEPPLPPPGWRLRGALVAHLHEHKAAITRMASIPETTLFASASADGCIRVWDCGKMEGRNIANRSRQVYNRQGGPLIGLTVCENNQSLASASHTGSIFVLRVEANSNKMSVTHERQLDVQEEGCAVDISYLDSGSQSLLVYATMYGSLVGWDLRAPGTAWKLDNSLKQGLITSFCIDSRQSWLTLGTSSGVHTCWDLRFRLPISTIVHPTNTQIRKVIRHPTEHSWVISAVSGNNEISMWNLETQFRQVVLWGSNAPPLSTVQGTQHAVCAMYGGTMDRSPFLYTGGTDMRIRYWDLESPSDSTLAVPAANDLLTPASIAYKSRLIDGTNVVQEVTMTPRSPPQRGGTTAEESPRAGPDQPQAGHHDWISDLTMCQTSQCFLLSGSRDGVIKVWK